MKCGSGPKKMKWRQVRRGGYSLRYMQLQLGMSDVFSLLGFCEIPNRFFTILIFNREWFAQKLDMYG